MSSTVQLGTLLRKYTNRGFSFATGSYLAYKWEVDYRGFNETIRVTLMSYHQSGMQGASMINLSLSTTLTLTINTLLSLGRK
jgi:hypothetical protein